MDWSDLKIFLAVARAGTLGAAARQVGQTQPTLGRRLLEQALGQSLFQRTSGGFVLTDEGQAVLAHAERMEEEALGIARQVSGQPDRLSGFLRLSASEWFGTYVLTPVLAEFSRRHPDVAIELVTDTRLYSLSRREADLVFRIGAFDEPGRVKPVVQFGVEAKIDYVDHLHELPQEETAADLANAPYLADVVSYQHPDHDTAEWTVRTNGDADHWRPKEQGV